MTVEKKKVGTKGKKKTATPRNKPKCTQMTIQEQWQSPLVRGVKAKLRKKKRMAKYFYTVKKQKQLGKQEAKQRSRRKKASMLMK